MTLNDDFQSTLSLEQSGWVVSASTTWYSQWQTRWLDFFSLLHPCILKIVFNFAYGLNYAVSPIRTLTTGLNMSILFILLNLDILQDYLNTLWRNMTPGGICLKGYFKVACHLSSGLWAIEDKTHYMNTCLFLNYVNETPWKTKLVSSFHLH